MWRYWRHPPIDAVLEPTFLAVTVVNVLKYGTWYDAFNATYRGYRLAVGNKKRFPSRTTGQLRLPRFLSGRSNHNSHLARDYSSLKMEGHIHKN